VKEPKQQSYYIPLPKILKVFGKRLAKLHQEVLLMKHYWKVRCRERKTFAEKNKKLKTLIIRMRKLEKTLNDFFKRKHFTIHNLKKHRNAQNQRCYPLFISHHEYTRLKILLKPKKKKGEK